jgi:hypothetical protein
VFETTRPGLFVLDVNLARVRDLRAQEDGIASQRTNAAKAGLLTQWQRPELYREAGAPRAVRPPQRRPRPRLRETLSKRSFSYHFPQADCGPRARTGARGGTMCTPDPGPVPRSHRARRSRGGMP